MKWMPVYEFDFIHIRVACFIYNFVDLIRDSYLSRSRRFCCIDLCCVLLCLFDHLDTNLHLPKTRKRSNNNILVKQKKWCKRRCWLKNINSWENSATAIMRNNWTTINKNTSFNYSIQKFKHWNSNKVYRFKRTINDQIFLVFVGVINCFCHFLWECEPLSFAILWVLRNFSNELLVLLVFPMRRYLCIQSHWQPHSTACYQTVKYFLW